MLTQETLDAWHDQYDVLFRNTSDGVISVDRTGILNQINPAAATMLRCAPEDCLGKKPGAAFHDLPALLDLLTTDNRRASRKIALPDKRIALGIVERYETGGRVVLLRDVTEREELDSRREMLITRVAHDLRNPISAIFGFAELVDLYGTLEPEQKRFLVRISQTAHKVQNSLYSLIDLAWVESGMPMDLQPVDMDKVIRQAVDDLSRDAEKQQITIMVSTQHPMPIVMGDAMRLQQVVHNLLHNAIIYSAPEQSIAIHAFTQDAQLHCTVADQGMGIAEDELDQVFDRMYRSADEAVRAIPGGGVGLTMARTILKRHGGTISATSVHGRGSTFMFTLPLAE